MRRHLVIGALGVLLAGCASADPVGAEVRARLAHVAATSADVDGEVRRVECWEPSRHRLVDAGQPEKFRVTCRVHYVLAGLERYRDMDCIGEIQAPASLRYCYPWLPYDGAVPFEEGR